MQEVILKTSETGRRKCGRRSGNADKGRGILAQGSLAQNGREAHDAHGAGIAQESGPPGPQAVEAQPQRSGNHFIDEHKCFEFDSLAIDRLLR